MSVKMKSQYAKRTILSTMHHDLVDLLKEAGAYIAGGAVTSVFTNKDINDIDVYFPSEESLVRTLASIYRIDDLCLIEDIEQFCATITGTSQRTIMLRSEDQDVQFIAFKYFESPEDIFESFDYTVCMGAYCCGTGEFILHDDFMLHNSERRLKFHSGTDFPMMSLMRVDKYKSKGYSISKSELFRVIMTCMSLEINNWEDLESHVGGMYGYDLTDVFNKDEEFSLVSACEQLSDMHDRKIDSFTATSSWDFENLVDFLGVAFEHDDTYNGVFNTSKYVYKCVDDHWQSIYASWRGSIKYVEGEILDTKLTGKLFFHRDPLRPYVSRKNWVEAEILEGEKEISDCSKEKVVLKGKIRINRCFQLDNPPSNERSNIAYLLMEKYGMLDEEDEPEKSPSVYAYKPKGEE